MITNVSFSEVLAVLKSCRERNETPLIRAGHWSERYWLEIHFNPDHVWGIPTIIDPETLEIVDQMKNRSEQITFDDMLANSFWSII